ncbi:uncharacterized protein JCM6883_004627 [Sporobolomyces salmoneus]|uniref:uncharacterized protein n=1 Tax=Sporobolomyces salmoneus TaxID=183962 RepID=UPI0031750DE6
MSNRLPRDRLYDANSNLQKLVIETSSSLNDFEAVFGGAPTDLIELYEDVENSEFYRACMERGAIVGELFVNILKGTEEQKRKALNDALDDKTTAMDECSIDYKLAVKAYKEHYIVNIVAKYSTAEASCAYYQAAISRLEGSALSATNSHHVTARGLDPEMIRLLRSIRLNSVIRKLMATTSSSLDNFEAVFGSPPQHPWKECETLVNSQLYKACWKRGTVTGRRRVEEELKGDRMEKVLELRSWLERQKAETETDKRTHEREVDEYRELDKPDHHLFG